MTLAFCILLAGSFLAALTMSGCMVLGTYAARHFIRNREKGRFRRYVAVLLCAVGIDVLVTGGS